MAELREIYEQMMSAVEEIDTQLDSLSGGKTAGRRKVVSNLMEKHSEVWSGPAAEIVEFIKQQSPEVQAAIVSGVQGELKTNFEGSVNSYVEALVDSQPVQEALITPEQGAELSSQRSTLYQKLKGIIDVASAIGEGDWSAPKMRRGSTGERGPRNLSLFVWSIDGEVVDMTISQIAKENGYEKYGELTKALREAGFDTRDGEELEDFTLPNGKVLSGYRPSDEDDEEDSDSDSELYGDE